jgi:predicted peptidase
LAKGNTLDEGLGLVVRGYSSKIDGSVQPYGLVIPENYAPAGTDRVRLDLWFHGRGETLSEVNFLAQRRTQVGTFAPPGAIVLHPYGRYNNAAKFAGEVDALEALDSVKRRYRIDEDRITVRGFSMGGASAWQMAAHYPGMWAAANPGAGFSKRPSSSSYSRRKSCTRRGGNRSSGTCTTAPTGRATFCIAPLWRTRANSIFKSRPPT